MAFTKKTVAIITIFLTIVYFAILYFMPERILGARDEGLMMHASKLLFLAVAAAIATSFALIILIKRDFIEAQKATYNRYKHYLFSVVRRDYVSRYRRSVLGVLWSLLHPILTMLVTTMVFSYLFRFNIEYFPVYFFSGQLIFGFFSESTTLAMSSLLGAEGVIKKIYIPKYIFPLSKVIISCINLVFLLLAYLVIFAVMRVPFSWTMLLIPLPLIYTFVFALGVAMFMSAMAVYFRDTMYLYSVLLTMWMFLTPIMYPVEILPDWLLPYYGLNPLYHFVDYFRNVAMWGNIPDLWSNLVCIGFALASLCIGTYTFMTKQDRFFLYL